MGGELWGVADGEEEIRGHGTQVTELPSSIRREPATWNPPSPRMAFVTHSQCCSCQTGPCGHGCLGRDLLPPLASPELSGHTVSARPFCSAQMAWPDKTSNFHVTPNYVPVRTVNSSPHKEQVLFTTPPPCGGSSWPSCGSGGITGVRLTRGLSPSCQP